LADKNPNFKKIKNGQSFNYEPGFLIKRRLVDPKVSQNAYKFKKSAILADMYPTVSCSQTFAKNFS
jgi:hypothetical protein